MSLAFVFKYVEFALLYRRYVFKSRTKYVSICHRGSRLFQFDCIVHSISAWRWQQQIPNNCNVAKRTLEIWHHHYVLMTDNRLLRPKRDTSVSHIESRAQTVDKHQFPILHCILCFRFIYKSSWFRKTLSSHDLPGQKLVYSLEIEHRWLIDSRV